MTDAIVPPGGTAIPAAALGRHRFERIAAAPTVTIRRAGYVILALQLIGFLAWSTTLYNRFALTIDFAQYQQAWYLIAHGHLNPVSTVGRGYFWQNHSELIIWPLALTYWLWPHGVTLLWLQDICVVGAEAVAFTWICEIARRQGTGKNTVLLVGTGLVLLAGNPWIWWSISFDFHTESLAILFAVLLVSDLANGRNRAWAWLVPLLACGDVAATYVLGFGIATLLSGRDRRRKGVLVAGCGLAAVATITITHGNLGSPLNGYASIVGIATKGVTSSPGVLALAKGMATHPLSLWRQIWSKRLDIWANLGSAGALGFAFIWILPVLSLILIENDLVPGLLFAMPSYQDLVIYVLVPVGTVAILGWLLNRHFRIGHVVTCLILIQAIGTGAAWWPQLGPHWLRVSPAAAQTLSALDNRIPGSSDVVASEGVVGRFSSRVHLSTLTKPDRVQVHGQTWFVVAPTAGVEVQSTASAMAFMAKLAGPMHATLVTHANGVWAFRWSAPPKVTDVTIPGASPTLPAWAAPGSAGEDVLTGPVAGWRVRSTDVRGYVADGLQWQEPLGIYQAAVSLSASGPVNVEVWNDNCGTLLARRSVPATSGVTSVGFQVTAPSGCAAARYFGWGPFRAEFLPPPAGQRLEVRVWSPGHERVSVYSASLTATSHHVGRPTVAHMRRRLRPE